LLNFLRQTTQRSVGNETVIRRLILGLAFMAVSTVTVVAKADNERSYDAASVKAVEIAHYLADNSLSITLDEKEFATNLESMSRENQLSYLRSVTLDTLVLRNNLKATELIDTYFNLSVELEDNRNIALAKLYNLYNQHRDTGGKFKEFNKLQTLLTPYLDSIDWVVSHRANLILSLAESYSLDLNTALSNALDAYNSIPNEKSIYVDEAVAESLYLIAYLQNLLNNPEMAVEATEKLISKRLESATSSIHLVNGKILRRRVNSRNLLWRLILNHPLLLVCHNCV